VQKNGQLLQVYWSRIKIEKGEKKAWSNPLKVAHLHIQASWLFYSFFLYLSIEERKKERKLVTDSRKTDIFKV
jgi:hypothetical protein